VGGDNKFDVRLAATDTGKCSLTYNDAIDSPAQTDLVTDFSTTLHQYPSNAALGQENVNCNAATAAQFDSILSHNPTVQNVQVTKSADVTDGAKFEVTVGQFNYQNTNTGGEIGQLNLAGVSGEKLHPMGDHSDAIARALTSLPYNVIPSVTVSRESVMSSDYTSDDVAFGNSVQQKYRVTFSDAANAGDQNTLQCNAAGCDEDGCAPRYAGVSHEKFISTKYYEPQGEGSSTTDYRTAIVATGQGGFWLRHYKAARETLTTFTSGTYYIHRDLGNGKVSSATFQYNSDQAAIQTALQTVEGWSGVAVSCNSGASSFATGKGTPGSAGHSTAAGGTHGFECYVTYPVGYDDGARLPTMTYDNFNGALKGAVTGSDVDGMKCQNEICMTLQTDFPSTATSNFAIGLGDGSATSARRMENNNGYFYIEVASPHTQTATIPQTVVAVGQTVVGSISGCVGTVAIAGTVTNLHIILTNGIDCVATDNLKINGADKQATAATAAKHAPFTTGTYEIIRTATKAAGSQIMFWAPGQADCASYTACINPNSITVSGLTLGQIYETTPLMPMWPDISNSIALHDSTLRVVIDANQATAEPMSAAARVAGAFDLMYGTLGYASTTKFNVGSLSGTPADYDKSTCAAVQAHLLQFSEGSATAGFSTTNTPYPSLVDPNDNSRSLCDCNKIGSGLIAPFQVFFDITCPAFIANHLWVATQADASRLAAKTATNEKLFVNFVYLRQTPPSGIETKVAVGDKLTILASGSNNNKQFTVKSFVDDGKWGTGRGNIWSTAAGFLGKDHTNGFNDGTNGIVLSASMNYRAYGDFVQFAKVEPAPVGTDYQITEMKAVGQNSTVYTRTLESISTTQTSVVTLTFNDPGTTDGDATTGFTHNAAGLTGTFQLIYDGEETAVMQATASAADMADVLAGVSTIGVAPTVTKSAQTLVDLSVTWSITFDAKSGDAKKLTFKYTDTIGQERQSSAVLGSGSAATPLANTISTFTTGMYQEYAKKDIVMQYTQEGSTFFDALDKTAGSVHDELAADTTVGTTFDVASSEDIHLFFFDETGNTADSDARMCVVGAQKTIVFEYNGKFSAPANLCATLHASTGSFSADSVFQTALRLVAGLETATVTLVAKGSSGTTAHATSSNDAFDNFFAWGATHKGYAVGNLKVTLPLGVDGSTFNVHVMTANGKGLGLGDSTITMAGQTYLHRARNNNGRSFTVTQAYENKVAGAVSFGTALAATTNLKGSAFNVVTTIAVTGLTANTYNPGTYYNVKLHADTTTSSGSEAGVGLFATVTVAYSGVKKVEISAGGHTVIKGEDYFIACDTRIHAGLTDCDGTFGTNIKVTLGASGNAETGQNILHASLQVGAAATASAGDRGDICAQNNGNVRHVATTLVALSKILNAIVNVKCTGGNADAATAVVVSGGSTTGAALVDTAANLGDADMALIPLGSLGATGDASLTVAKEFVNTFYHQAAFYDTTTPKFSIDALHDGITEGALEHASQTVTVMGGRTGTSSYPYDARVGADNKQMFDGLQDLAMQGAGYKRRAATSRTTSSVIMGAGGAGATQTILTAYSEQMDKYAYVGRGFDQLTVTPTPDAMTGKKVVITYHGAAGGCSVTEVDRGTHESSVCSGRGNCDFSSGTCLCDAGYTLEACSEQTVLV
jgi:hypothetical protein